MVVDLHHGVDKTSISEVEIVINGVLPVLVDGGGHGLIEGGVYDVNLVGTFDLVVHVLVSHKLEKLDLRVLIELLGHLTWGDVVDVLEPLEVRAGDTTTVDEKIWGDDDTLFDENLFGSVGSWTVGSLEDSLDLN